MEWYKHNFFRNLVDMHIPNGEGLLEKFDPAAYAANIKRSGATAAYIYGSNCLGLCFFPTEVGIRHQAAERDIFGQTLRECRKLDLTVVGYLNSWGSFVCDRHPEWSAVDAQGRKMRDDSRYGNPCPNNPEYSAYFLALVKEFVTKYRLDGLWVDMVGIWEGVCHCEACREKYRREYGRDLPETDSMDSPDFADYVRFKGKSVADYAAKIRETALSADPTLSVSIQAASAVHLPKFTGLNDPAYFRASDYLAGDFDASRENLNMISRMLYKLSENLPFEFMTARCTSLYHHTMNKDIGELLSRAYASMMYKGAFLFIDAIDPSGEMDADFYEEMSHVSKSVAPYLPYAGDRSEKPLRDIAVYFNWDGFADPEGAVFALDQKRAGYFQEHLLKITSALSEAGLDYDILSPKNLSELSDYQVVILSSMETVSKAEAEAIREYVRRGGNVYISGETSLRNERGVLQEDFLLGDLMHVSFAGKQPVKPNYFAPALEAPELFGRHTAKYPNMLNERTVKVTCLEGGTPLACVTLPLSDEGDWRTFSSAISNPPMVSTKEPAIVESRYGDGKVIYSAGTPEADSHPDNRALFTGLIRRLCGALRVNIWAPSCVDYTVYAGKACLKIHLLNSQSVYPPLPIAELQIGVDLGGRTVRSVRDVFGGTPEWEVSGGTVYVRTGLEDYKLIVVELE